MKSKWGKPMQLKDYQQRALDTLREYFRKCLQYGKAGLAFTDITSEKFAGLGLPYHPVIELPNIPYVCCRIPTGGGKTLVAVHSIRIAREEYLRSDAALILWLTPSDAIRQQTLNALKNRLHPYRQALEESASTVNVIDLSEALSVQPGTLSTGITIIVSTIQAIRIDDPELRKFYEPAGALMSHFGVENPGGLETYENGQPIPSLENVLRLHRPVVIVDEAQNARTPLSFKTLARFNASCILEFTATPVRDGDNPSNVLFTVSAAELKSAGMIKLPIRLEAFSDWRNVVSQAVAMRNHLEDVARIERSETGEYLRPIVLVQAQPERKDQDTLTYSVLKEHLIKDQQIPENQIAIATGKEDDLSGQTDLLEPSNPIRYIITVQKLREGWDCPFAYILCTVAEQRSEVAVEQILGRVLRMPKAMEKHHPDLNKAYAFATSQNFIQTVNNLKEAMTENGFEKQEVNDLIISPNNQQPNSGTTGLPLFNMPVQETDSIHVVEPPNLDVLPEETLAKVSFDPQSNTFCIHEPLTTEDIGYVVSAFPNSEVRKNVAAQLTKKTKLSQNQPERPVLSIPLLAIRQGDLYEEFEESYLLEHMWNLAACDPFLTENEFPSKTPESQSVEIGINQIGRVSLNFNTNFMGELQAQMNWLAREQEWTVTTLSTWLDRKIKHVDIPSNQSVVFIRGAIERLIQDNRATLSHLVKEKFRLRIAIENLIQKYRQAARKQAYQGFLLPGCATPLVVRPEICFTYDTDPMKYPYPPDNSLYPGQHSFHKHYYPTVGELNNHGEEFDCAMFIDTLPEVKAWVRNLDRRPRDSFWLQTSSDRFYPDFVCLLNDDRYLVVEYKGQDRWSNDDSEEKRMIGGVWADRSGGKCLFVMPNGYDMDALRAKVG
jgi:type III restriction enzyme